jgi:hypothetical protein
LAVSYNNDVLIAGVKRRAMIPTSQSTFLPFQILDIANDEMNNEITPLLMSLMGNYLVDYTDHTMTTTTETNFPIPAWAIGMKLKDVVLIDPNTVNNPPPQMQNLPQLSHEGVDQWWNSNAYYNVGFYLQGNEVVLFPQGQPNYILRLYYYRRPNKLVPVDECAKVQTVDYNTGEVVVETIPSTWANGTSVCCVSSTPGFKLEFEAQDITGLSNTTFTLADVEDIEIGDYICLEGESAIAQVPPECIPVLEQAAAVKCLEALGDPRWEVAQAKYNQIKLNFQNTCAPRVDNEPKKIVSKNGFADLYGYYGNYRRWW